MLQKLSFSIIFVLIGCTDQISIQEIPNPTSDNSKYPRLTTDNSGSVFMSWYEVEADSTLLKYAVLENEDVWGQPNLIEASDSWFVNWADFPSVVSINGEPIAAHWLDKVPGNKYSYNVTLKSLQSGDVTIAHDDNTLTEHGFVSMQSTSDSTFYAVWLDGRNTGNSRGHDSHVVNLASAMTIRGAEFDSNLNKISEYEIDQTTCDCCNTALTQIPGSLIVAYRNRTESEVRDIYVSRFDGTTWDEPSPVHNDNWEIAACPVNGPALSSWDKTIALAWFTGANDLPQVKLSFSKDAGLNFDSPIILDSESVIGRVDVQMVDPNTVWISYLNRVDGAAELTLTKITSDGQIEETISIPNLDPSRATGFPQITKKGDAILVAWTDISSETPSIKTAVIR